jgi:adenine deaminase
MLCSDDNHPDDLMEGHINQLCARAVAHGVPLFNVLRAACLNPVEHYGLHCGLLRPGDPADVIRLHDLISFKVMETWIDGQCVARDGHSLLPKSQSPHINQFHTSPKQAADFAVRVASPACPPVCGSPATAVSSNPTPPTADCKLPTSTPLLRIIEALDGQIVTGSGTSDALIQDGLIVADPSHDILKIAVVNRYADTPPAVAFVRGIGIKSGAIASSVAHDCHNIVAVGTSDDDLARVVNLVIQNQGGIALAGPDDLADALPLPVAGLMSDSHAEDAAAAYARLTKAAKSLGSPLHAPYMTLSFLALLVIPALKLSDLGLFDGTKFEFVPIIH